MGLKSIAHEMFPCSKSKKKDNKRKSGTFNPITEHLMNDKSVSGPLLMSVFSCMAWGDGE